MTASWAFLGDRPRTSGSGGGGGGATGVVALSDHGVYNDYNAFIQYEPDGEVFANSGLIGSWVTGTFDPAAYEIRATKLIGATPVGSALSTWLSLASARSWQVSATYLTKTCNLRVEVRRASDGIVLDTADVTLSAGGEGGGDM